MIHGLPSDDEEDLGWLACWASNDVGNQREPCLFRIMPAGMAACEIYSSVDSIFISLQVRNANTGGVCLKTSRAPSAQYLWQNHENAPKILKKGQ